MPLFYSPHAGYQLLVKPQYDRRHPTTGDIIETDQAIWVQFGKFGEVQTFMNPETGETHTGAQILGHYYDTDAEAVEKGWDQETHDLVVRRLRDAVRREPYRLQEIARDPVKAAPPWPTYDDCAAAEAVSLAKTLGLEAETVAYERENKNRPTVIDGLTAKPEAAASEDDEPAGSAVPVKEPAGSRTISV